MTRQLLPIAQAGSDADADLGSLPARALSMAIVNMPWARADGPSIQCGLLQAIVRRAGHRCDTHYPNLHLAAILGATVYQGLVELRAERLHLLGEWLFSYAAFGEVTPDSAYLADYPELDAIWRDASGRGVEHLVELRREVLTQWLEELVDSVDWGSYDVVGFTSTFAQNTASLALGRLLKARYPQSLLVYGGANFDGEMGPEYLRALPWLDYVVVGEGDTALPRLLHAIAAGSDPPPPGVLHRVGPGRVAITPPAPPIRDMDDLPFPDYRDYFSGLDRHGRAQILGRRPVTLPVEFSRGCWWGEKHHCTFCGLNTLGMTYRSKTPVRGLEELTALLTEYPAIHVEAVDNILDMTYISSLCSELAERHWDVNLFFEVKANLTRRQLATLKAAGILRIQPGIESLSTSVLKLMRKGSTKLLNIRLLKWASYYGIHVSWNVLTGFPGENDTDQLEQAELAA